MRKKWSIWGSVLSVILLAGVLVHGAQAGNFHFNLVDFTLGSLNFQGDLAGIGNESVEVTLTAYGTVSATCQNKGGAQAPGRNPIAVGVQQTAVFVTDQNGHALVQVEAPDPTAAGFEPSPTPKEAGCPNENWIVVDIVDGSTNWTAANVVVKDSLGLVQLNVNYTCTTTFTNGVATSLSCSPS